METAGSVETKLHAVLSHSSQLTHRVSDLDRYGRTVLVLKRVCSQLPAELVFLQTLLLLKLLDAFPLVEHNVAAKEAVQ